MKYLKAYINSVGRGIVVFGVINLLLGAVELDVRPLYSLWICLFAAVAGPIRLMIEKK